MGLTYRDLTADIRQAMLDEIDHDLAKGPLYTGSWHSPQGVADWPTLLRAAAQNHDDDWLAQQMRANNRLNRTAERRKPKGVGMITYNVPVTAAETIAESEFNRFYVRGLCRYAMANGIGHLIVYRAKAVAIPRPGSEQRIGAHVDPQAVLNDLRASAQGLEPALGVPPGPNSGLTVHLP